MSKQAARPAWIMRLLSEEEQRIYRQPLKLNLQLLWLSLNRYYLPLL